MDAVHATGLIADISRLVASVNYALSLGRKPSYASDLEWEILRQVRKYEYWSSTVGLGKADDGAVRVLHHQILDEPEVGDIVMELLPLAWKTFQGMNNSLLVRPRKRDLFRSTLRAKAELSRDIQLIWQVIRLLNTLVPVENDPTFAADLSSDADADLMGPLTADHIAARQIGDLETRVNKVVLRRELQSWVLGTDAQSHLDGTALHEWSKGTCDWMLNRQKYQSWLEPVGDKSKFLWIHGPPGSGKTVLCSRLVAHARTKTSSPIAHFFLSYESEKRRDPEFALQSWIAQVMAQREDMLDYVNRTMIAEQKSQSPRSTRDIVHQLWWNAAATIPGSTFILDGLDECTVPIEDFLHMLGRTLKARRIRVLIVSRDQSETREVLTSPSFGDGVDFSAYGISHADISDDLQTFSRAMVDSKLASRTLSTKARMDIAQRMASRSEGAFILIKIEAEAAMVAQSTSELQDMMNETPSDIDSIYKKYWERIMGLPAFDRKRAVLLMTWVALARRPLAVGEIEEALLIDVGRKQGSAFLDEELPDVIDYEYVDRNITWLCRPLLIVVKSATEGRDGTSEWETVTVHFTHSTARSFFLHQIDATELERRPLGHDGNSAGHSLLARLCLSYIQSPLVWQRHQQHSGGEEYGKQRRAASFFDYAASCWAFHFKRCRETHDEETLSLAEALFDRSNPVWDDWTQYSDNQRGFSVQSLQDERKSEGGQPGPLYYAASEGLPPIVERLLKRGEDVNHRSGMGRIALHAACSIRNLISIQLLLDAGADPTARNESGLSPIHVATVAGDFSIVLEMLNRHPELVNSRDVRGKTPLHLASEFQRLDVLGLLLDFDADTDNADVHGLSPLHRAVRRGGQAITLALIESGANVNQAGHHSILPMHVACFYGNSEVLKMLLEHGATVDAVMNQGLQGIHLACSPENSDDIVRQLLEKNADPNARNDIGLTPLHNAARLGHEVVTEMLLNAGANTQEADATGMAALHIAAKFRQGLVISQLLQFHADLFMTDDEGRTALHIATQFGHVDIMSQLLEAGSDPYLADIKGWNAFHLAARYGSEEMFSLLLEHVTETISAVTGNGWSVLSLAVSSSSQRVPKLIVDHIVRAGGDINGANPNPQSPFYQSTALHVAAGDGFMDSVKLLLDNGADLERKDKDGFTALEKAMNAGFHAVVRFLLYRGAYASMADGSLSPIQADNDQEESSESATALLKSGGKSKGTSDPQSASQPPIRPEEAGDKSEDSNKRLTINALSQACLIELKSLGRAILFSPYGVLDSTVDDQAGRFQIWAGNIGALQKPQSTGSLDYRLKDFEVTKASVQSGLERLQGAVKRALLIATGARPDRSKDTLLSGEAIVHQTIQQVLNDLSLGRKATQSQDIKPPMTELSQLFLNIQTCITHLFELSVLIRQERPRGRTQPRGLDKWDVDPSPDITSIKDKFPKLRQNDWFAQRMGTWITQQREYIRYRQKHRQRLAKQPEVSEEDGRSVLLSGQVTTMATSFYGQNTPQPPQQGADDLVPESIRSSATSFATTSPADIGTGRRIPELTEIWLDGVHLSYNSYIECPYCRTIQKFADQYQWKRHVYSDLQLYVCTNKSCEAQPFSSSHEWFQHEMEAHRRQWKCIICNTKCVSSAALDGHFTEKHAGAVSVSQRAVMVKAGEQAMTRFDGVPCLLCEKWPPPKGGDATTSSRKFRSHMEKHMQELAREALPLAIDGLDIRDSQSDEDDEDGDDDDVDSEEAVDVESQAVHHVEFLEIAVSDPISYRPGESNPMEMEWTCLAPRGDGTTCCLVKHVGTRLLMEHYTESHTPCSQPDIMYQCLACEKTAVRKHCPHCLDSAVYFGPILCAQAYLQESLVESYRAVIDQVMKSRLAGSSRRNAGRVTMAAAEGPSSQDGGQQEVALRGREPGTNVNRGLDTGRDRFVSDPDDIEAVDGFLQDIWKIMRADEDVKGGKSTEGTSS